MRVVRLRDYQFDFRADALVSSAHLLDLYSDRPQRNLPSIRCGLNITSYFLKSRETNLVNRLLNIRLQSIFGYTLSIEGVT